MKTNFKDYRAGLEAAIRCPGLTVSVVSPAGALLGSLKFTPASEADKAFYASACRDCGKTPDWCTCEATLLKVAKDLDAQVADLRRRLGIVAGTPSATYPEIYRQLDRKSVV